MKVNLNIWQLAVRSPQSQSAVRILQSQSAVCSPQSAQPNYNETDANCGPQTADCPQSMFHTERVNRHKRYLSHRHARRRAETLILFTNTTRIALALGLGKLLQGILTFKTMIDRACWYNMCWYTTLQISARTKSGTHFLKVFKCRQN